ncbi:MAG: zinc ribbon domain-containing protein [Oscillospiraceae bacterium]|nr:zinc ribbon domain-containing protein [Oscillospiraceae bacterium]
MKKAIRLSILFLLISLLLLTTSAIAINTIETDDMDISLEEHLIGTWRWGTQHSWIVIFREDGTMLDGPPGIRTIYSWQIIDGRLYVDNVDWNLNIVNENTITMFRSGSTHTYIWYSDSTDGETSLWIIWVIIGVVLLVIAGIIVTIVLIAVRAGRRKQKKSLSQSANYYNPQDPHNQYSYNQQNQYNTHGSNQQSQYNPHDYNQQNQQNQQNLRCASCNSPLTPGNKYCENCGSAQ